MPEVLLWFSREATVDRVTVVRVLVVGGLCVLCGAAGAGSEELWIVLTEGGGFCLASFLSCLASLFRQRRAILSVKTPLGGMGLSSPLRVG